MRFNPVAYQLQSEGIRIDLVSALMGDIAGRSEAYQTFSGDIVQFRSKQSAPIKEIIASIAPVQDLHGYQNPWPAGGGKNKFDSSIMSDANTNFKYAQIQLQPNTQYTMSSNCPLESGSALLFFILSGDTPSSGTNGVYNGVSRTLTTGADGIAVVAYRIMGSVTASQLVGYNSQIETGSSSSSFSPYANICPISGWTAANVYRTGVNIWNGDVTEQTWISDVSGTTSAQLGYCVTDYIPIVGGCSYYKSKNDSGRILFFDKNYQSITNVWNVMSSGATTFTAPSNAKYIRVTITNAYKDSFCINYPATDTDYHAYSGTSLTIPFTVNGDSKTIYGGTVSVDEDGKVKLTADKAYLYVDGSVSVSNVSYHQTTGLYFTTVATPIRGINTAISFPHLISNRFIAKNGVVIGQTYITGNGNILVAVLPDQTIATVEDANTWFSDNPTQFVYDLAVPVEYDLADVTVLSTLQGVNTMWADTGSISVTAKGKPITRGVRRVYNP